jgi:nucleoside-triphosphatase
MVKNMLLEGLPGVGKTTLLCRIAERMASYKIGGFVTEEIRESGRRMGFRVRAFSGETGILAHIRFGGGSRVGKYGVNVNTFESVGVRAVEKALESSEIILIDEIGKMELFSRRFRETVIRGLDSPKPVLATVMSRSHPFADDMKSRSDVRIIEVTHQSRERLVDALSNELQKMIQ